MDISAQEWLKKRHPDGRGADGRALPQTGSTSTRHLPEGLSTAAIALLPDAVGVFAAISDDAGVVIDFEWLLANHAAEALIGRAGLIGQRLRGDGGDARCAGLFPALLAGLDGPDTRVVSASLGGSNRTRWRVSATPFPGGVCATLIDLGPDAPSMAETLASALERSAESFALFDSSDTLVHTTGRLKQFLPELADLLVPGTPFETLVRRSAQMDSGLTTETDREQWIAARLAHHRQTDKPFTLRAQDGRWLLVSEHAAADDGVLVIYADVTPMKRNEERLRAREAEARAARRDAERANRAKSEFLALMSHELRTPLNAVLGFSELLMSEAFGPLGSPRYRDYATDIRDSGEHLLALINDILDLSRSESGRMPMSSEAVELNTTIAQVVGMIREKAEETGVSLQADVARDLPMLLGDPRAIRQMLLNLLSNAVKFTPSGGKAMLTAAVMPDGGIGVMIADTGVGIPAADLFRIQEPFERADVTIARPTEGAGLGLPIVKRLVELHGGRLELSSELGVGTSAVLIFPASRSLPRNLCPPLPVLPSAVR